MKDHATPCRSPGRHGTGCSVTYGYNPALQLTSIAQPVGGVTKTTWIAYNKDGLPSTITYPTSTSVQHSLGYTASHLPQTNGWAPYLVSYSYDSTERLTKRMSALGDSARVLTYNARGELTNVRDEDATVEVCPTGEETDCYWEEQTTVVSNIPYTYDAVWNRTDSGISLQATSNRYQTFGGYTFEYDFDGNTTRKYKSGFNQVFSWNSLGQLTGVTTNGVAVTYRYNGGVRLARHGRAGIDRALTIKARRGNLRRVSRRELRHGTLMRDAGSAFAAGTWVGDLEPSVYMEVAAGGDFRWWTLLPGGGTVAGVLDLRGCIGSALDS